MGAVPIVIAGHSVTAQSVPGFICSESIADQADGPRKHGDIKYFCHHSVMRKENFLATFSRSFMIQDQLLWF